MSSFTDTADPSRSGGERQESSRHLKARIAVVRFSDGWKIYFADRWRGRFGERSQAVEAALNLIRIMQRAGNTPSLLVQDDFGELLQETTPRLYQAATKNDMPHQHVV